MRKANFIFIILKIIYIIYSQNKTYMYNIFNIKLYI
jgi:hypothetical protein